MKKILYYQACLKGVSLALLNICTNSLKNKINWSMKIFFLSILGIVLFSFNLYADYSYEDIAVLKNMEL